MKNLLSVLALVVAAGAAQAADNTDFKWNAQMRTRYTNNENSGFVTTQNNNFVNRNKLGMTMQKGESLSANVTLLQNMQWGNSTLGQPSAGATNSANNLLAVNEAWVWWKHSDTMSMKLGRASMTVADGKVISSNDYEATPFAFEGAGLIFDQDFGRISLFGVKAVDGLLTQTVPSTVATDPEAVYYGVSFDLKNLPDALKMVNIHLLQENTDINSATGAAPTTTGGIPTSSAPGLSVLRYGLTVAGETNNIDFDLTYAANQGKYKYTDKDVDWKGSMIDATVGYSMPEMMAFRVGLNYHTDTGNDSGTPENEQYQPFFYERHKTSGLMDVVGWGNLTYINAKLEMDPMEATTVGLQYTMFSRTTDKDSAYQQGSGANVGSALSSNSNSEKAIGSEIDLSVNHNYGNGVEMGLIYGMFTPGDYLKKNLAATVDAKNHNKIIANAKFTF